MPNSRTPRILGKIFKTLFLTFIFAVIALLIWRVFFSTGIPSTIKVLSVNETLADAYREHGDALILRFQDQGTVTRAEKNKGYFAVPECVFIPEANQVQIIFRYNNSTLRHLSEDYELDAVPSKSEDLFDVTLLRTTDLTPTDKSDDTADSGTLRKDRYSPVSVIREETSLYTYYRYVFDGVTVEELTADADHATDGVFVDIYYLGDTDYEKEAYGTLCVYSYDEEWYAYSLTGDDRDALAGN